MIKIVVIPKASASFISKMLLEDGKKYIAISINAHSDEDYPHYSNCVDRLDLEFLDVDIVQSGSFTAQMATDILDFVYKYKDDADVIVCQCLMGMSRSAGVAAAISKILFDTDDEFFKRCTPNRLIYRTILETHFNQ